jgi:hypothetical protein
MDPYLLGGAVAAGKFAFSPAAFTIQPISV